MVARVVFALAFVAARAAGGALLVDGAAPTFVTDVGFAAFSFELSSVKDAGRLSNPKLRELSHALGPSLMRIGGTSQDEVRYDLNTGAVESAVHAADVDRTFSFAAAANWTVSWGLNYLERLPGQEGAGPANMSQAMQMVDYARRFGATVGAFTFGNEPDPGCPGTGIARPKCNVSVAQHVADEQFLDLAVRYTYQGAVRVPMLTGPDAAHCCSYLEEFAAGAASVGLTLGALSWHHYYTNNKASPESFLSPSVLDGLQKYVNQTRAIRDAHQPQAKLWVGESASAYG
eukprot:Hpha_TRINITY_DN7651_c0_g1::TRINITY_DN7651_c0_g1_i1::g.19353::m.19353/K07964/HPSE; heparanase